MSPPSARRQNSSCDACRRSKRRCAALATNETPNSETSCTNCVQLGYKCTFNLAASAARQRKQKRRLSLERDTSPQPIEPRIYPARATTGNEDRAKGVADLSRKFGPFRSLYDASLQVSFADNSFHAEYALVPATTMELQCYDRSVIPEVTWLADQENYDDSQVLQFPSPSATEVFVPGAWHGSPMHLLNSSMTSLMLNIQLDEIHKVVFADTISRYLAYRCNVFAGCYKYSLTYETEEQPGRSCWGNRGSDSLSSETMEKPPASSLHDNDSWKATLIGIARFLDNFGPLYGNRLDAKASQKAELVLIASVSAFALQWLPSRSEEGHCESQQCARFKEVWFRTHSLLKASQEMRSFVRLYAVFLFHMTPIPEEALTILVEGEHPTDLLDCGLRQMTYLFNLIHQYGQSLTEDSIYKALLDASTRIFRWYGYVRDTVASSMTERQCVLPDEPITTKEPRADDELPDSDSLQALELFDICIPRIFNRATIHQMLLWRTLSNLRLAIGCSSEPMVGRSCKEVYACSTNLICDFNRLYGPSIARCITNFSSLSTSSKLSAAMLALFWNMCLLSMTEILDRLSTVQPDVCNLGISEAAREYEADALASITNVLRCLADDDGSTSLYFANHLDLDMPLISRHANVSLVVTAITKAIEHTISINQHHGRLLSTWLPKLQLYLSALIGLESKVAGLCVSRPVRRSLVWKHTDILLDCWTPNSTS